jgi:hypothetical protein
MLGDDLNSAARDLAFHGATRELCAVCQRIDAIERDQTTNKGLLLCSYPDSENLK